MSVEDLEAAVSHLSAVEFARFREWFEEFAADQWDRQIEADIRAGRFDAAGKRALAFVIEHSPESAAMASFGFGSAPTRNTISSSFRSGICSGREILKKSSIKHPIPTTSHAVARDCGRNTDQLSTP